LSPAQVHDTASYYSMYAFAPRGKTLIEMCTTLSCTLNGAEDLLQSTCKKLGIEPGARRRTASSP
jgi:NADH-quinone oxidoreductase subunit E